MSQTRQSEGVTIALLDLDGTVIDTEAQILNVALLDALQAQGVKDVCLFTAMFDNQIEKDVCGQKGKRPKYIHVSRL